MAEAISDTGPILHLSEVDRLMALSVFERLHLSQLVVSELRTYNVEIHYLEAIGVAVVVVPVTEEQREEAYTRALLAFTSGLLNEKWLRRLQPADLAVLALALADRLRKPILTDDIALRRALEGLGATVIGSIGVLVRAYKRGLLDRPGLNAAVDDLFERGTLFLSPAFQAYVRKLLADLP